MLPEILDSYLIESPEQAVALLNPLRGEIMAHLHEPASATEVARKLNETPQRINYHLKSLEKVGIVRRVGSRQIRNLVEVLFLAVARSFVFAESLSLKPETMRKFKDQGALAHLIHASERMKRDALLLMEQSDDQQVIASAALQLQVQLANPAQRVAFVEEYVSLVNMLVSKYQCVGDGSNPYQVLLAVYPNPSDGGNINET